MFFQEQVTIAEQVKLGGSLTDEGSLPPVSARQMALRIILRWYEYISCEQL